MFLHPLRLLSLASSCPEASIHGSLPSPCHPVLIVCAGPKIPSNSWPPCSSCLHVTTCTVFLWIQEVSSEEGMALLPLALSCSSTHRRLLKNRFFFGISINSSVGSTTLAQIMCADVLTERGQISSLALPVSHHCKAAFAFSCEKAHCGTHCFTTVN